MQKIKFNDIEHTILIEDKTCVITPKNIFLSDTIEEMLYDIGEYNINYLKEPISDNGTFYVI